MKGQDLGDLAHEVRVGELAGGEVHGHPHRWPIGRERSPANGLGHRFVEHPRAEGTHQPGFFGDLDELRRGQQATRRVLPAHQGFHPADATGGQLHARLVVHAQLASLDAVAQLAEQPETVDRRVDACAVVNLPAVAAARLGPVHGDVGPPDELFGRVVRSVGSGRPDAGGGDDPESLDEDGSVQHIEQTLGQ